jgi:hypothetical protein
VVARWAVPEGTVGPRRLRSDRGGTCDGLREGSRATHRALGRSQPNLEETAGDQQLLIILNGK